MNESNDIDINFVGQYSQGSVDSRADLYLLDDGYFCFTFMGGSLDAIKIGRWRKGNKADTVELEEMRPVSNPHPVLAKQLDRLETGMIGINFDGYSLSEAHLAAYAITTNNEDPKQLQKLFPLGKNNWSGTYALPLMEQAKAKYLFIADKKLERYEYPDHPGPLRVSQYDISGYDAIRVGFDRAESEPLMNTQATLKGGKLYLGRDVFGQKKELDAETESDVRQEGIAPILAKLKAQGTDKPDGHRSLAYNGVLLKPMKTFELPDSVVSEGAQFADEDHDEVSTQPTDDWQELVEQEKNRLATSFEKAKADPDHAKDFLDLSKRILEKKNRLAQHLPVVMEDQAELLVKILEKGNNQQGKELFYYIVDNTFPLVKQILGAKMPYSVSIVASQGMILANIMKDSGIADTVFNTLLKGWYDMNTHKNGTLIYNMACYYAVNSKTSEMLEAIKQARKHGKKPEQFLKDVDFKAYWSDPKFKKAME